MVDRIGKWMASFYLIALLVLVLLAVVVNFPLFRFVSGDSLNIVCTDFMEMVLGWAEWFTRLIPLFVFVAVVKNFWLGRMFEILPVRKV